MVVYSIVYVLLLAAYKFILGNGASWREVLFAFIRRSWYGLGRAGEPEAEMETIVSSAAKG